MQCDLRGNGRQLPSTKHVSQMTLPAPSSGHRQEAFSGISRGAYEEGNVRFGVVMGVVDA